MCLEYSGRRMQGNIVRDSEFFLKKKSEDGIGNGPRRLNIKKEPFLAPKKYNTFGDLEINPSS